MLMPVLQRCLFSLHEHFCLPQKHIEYEQTFNAISRRTGYASVM